MRVVLEGVWGLLCGALKRNRWKVKVVCEVT